MPAKATRNPDGSYMVRTPNMVHGKKMTKKNAYAQMRLLNALDHGWVPDKKKSKK